MFRGVPGRFGAELGSTEESPWVIQLWAKRVSGSLRLLGTVTRLELSGGSRGTGQPGHLHFFLLPLSYPSLSELDSSSGAFGPSVLFCLSVSCFSFRATPGGAQGLFLAQCSEIGRLEGPYGMSRIESGLKACKANTLPAVLWIQLPVVLLIIPLCHECKALTGGVLWTTPVASGFQQALPDSGLKPHLRSR